MKNFRALVVKSALLVSAVACSGEEGPNPETPEGMTLLARLEKSPTHVISFYDSDLGVVIGETGRAEELAEHVPLDTLRAQGTIDAYRTLSGNPEAVVPAKLLAAEGKWQARLAKPSNASGAASAPPPNLASPVSSRDVQAAPATNTNARIGAGVRANLEGDAVAQKQQALGGLSTDAGWWASLPICQSSQTGQTSSGATATVAWYDTAWCVTDVTWARTGYVDTMYYEATAFAQGNDAKVTISKWINGAWQTVVNVTVPYRYYQTFSFPPENGAYYQSYVEGTGGYGIGIAERFRLAMPKPAFVNNKPNNVEYQFANDLQGITHDANNWFLTRTEYDCGGFICTSSHAVRGEIAKVPLTTSLSSAISGRAMPSAWKSAGYKHFGDLVHVNGYLYVGMDGNGGAIGIYDTNLNAIGYAKTSRNSSVPLVAYNPKDGFFYIPESSTVWDKYQVTLGSSPQAIWKGTLTLSRGLSDYQGGKFSPKGNLWVLTGFDSKNREIWGIDGVTGAVLIQGGLSPGDADECEGVDIFDLDSETRPGMAGQLHLQLLNNQLDDDNWWLMHWRAPMSRL